MEHNERVESLIEDDELDNDSLEDDPVYNNNNSTIAGTPTSQTTTTPGRDLGTTSSQQEEEDEDEQAQRNTTIETVIWSTGEHLASLYSSNVREIGKEAVWSLSSAKPGNGVEQLRDDSIDTYWQSDGAQPHLINIQFSKRARVSEVAFYLDYNLDESYTPKRISICAGMTFHDLEEVRIIDLNEPNGWISVPLIRKLDHLELEDDAMEEEEKKNGRKDRRRALKRPIRAFFIQICVVSMHQNGRDTHVRQVKIFGPRSHSSSQSYSNSRYHNQTMDDDEEIQFTTVALSQFNTIR